MKHTTALLLTLLASTLSGAHAQGSARAAPATPAPQARTVAPDLGAMRLTDVRLADLARLLSQVGEANVVVTNKVSDLEVSLYLRNATVEDMVRNACRAAGVWYRLDPRSKTYVIMSAEEYQKDLAIVRDEKTRVFTLRHHNVVSTANAIKGLFGPRVTLAAPVEETAPTNLGTGARTRTGGSASNGTAMAGGSTGTGQSAGTTRSGAGNDSTTAMGAVAQRLGAAGVGAAATEAGADVRNVSQDRLVAQAQVDSKGQALVGTSDLQSMAARQAPPIAVTYNKLNNLLMVRTGDEPALAEIATLVAEMDRPPQQVLLEMKILEVTLDDSYKSVFDIGQGSASGLKTSYTEGAAANMVWQVVSDTLNLRLQLLASEKKLKELSAPMLVAANNQLARLFIGDERILTVGASTQTTTGTSGATNTTITVETERRDVGETLSILPRINGDRSVTLTVDQDSSTVKVGDTTIPLYTNSSSVINFPIDTVNTANLQVTAHAQDGMTVAIGGMISESVERTEGKVPVLGDIPGLGFFFKRDVRSKVRKQIVLLVTPRIIASAQEGDTLAQRASRDFATDADSFGAPPALPKWAGKQAD